MNILISAYTGLGNFILLSPLFSSIMESYPKANIDLIIEKDGNLNYLKKNYNYGKVIDFNKNINLWGRIKFIKYLVQENYDYIIMPFLGQIEKIFLFLLLFRFNNYIIHYDVKNRSIKNKIKNTLYRLHPFITEVELDRNDHEIKSYLNLLKKLGINKNIDDARPDLFISPNSAFYKKYDLIKNQYIVLQPGCRNGLDSYKNWSTNNFNKLIELINNNLNTKIVLIGNEDDLPAISKIKNKNNVLSLVGLTSMLELVSIIKNSKVNILHNSSPMHIGWAIHANVIVINGTVNFYRNYHSKNNFINLFPDNDNYSFPANKVFMSEKESLDKYGKNYLSKIPASIVFKTIKKFL